LYIAQSNINTVAEYDAMTVVAINANFTTRLNTPGNLAAGTAMPEPGSAGMPLAGFAALIIMP
jgi:hypothetical protein